jgi:hypothetical protein
MPTPPDKQQITRMLARLESHLAWLQRIETHLHELGCGQLHPWRKAARFGIRETQRFVTEAKYGQVGGFPMPQGQATPPTG